MKSVSLAKRAVFFFVGLSVLFSARLIAQPSYPRNPKEAEIVFTDLEHFVEAYAQLQVNPDTLGVLQTVYFDRGSSGLKEFVTRHQLTPELMKQAMATNPER